MKINLKVLNKQLKEIADKHQQIDSYFWGDFVRFYEEKSVKHRTLIATFVRVPTASRTRTTINLILTIADRSYRDNRDLDDIQSDAVEILNDIITIINRSKRWREFLTQEVAPSIDVFQERGGDMVAGAFASINFNINNQSDICAIPIVDYDFNESFTPFCQPSIFLINGVEIDTVQSGSSRNIRVVNVDGSETGTFDGTNWVVEPNACPDAEYNLINTDNQDIEVGSIESGESKDIVAPDSNFVVKNTNDDILQSGNIVSGGGKEIIAPDAEILVNGSSDFPAIPSGGSENIMVENTQGSAVGAFDSDSNSWVIPDSNYTVIDQRGVNYGSGSIPSGATQNINIINPRRLNFKVRVGKQAIDSFTVEDNSTGVFTNIDVGGLTNVVIQVNSTVVTAPITLVLNDVVEIDFDTATADTVINFTE
jgi:hypothetical protein